MCEKPVYVRKMGVLLPCGHCYGCRVNNARAWTLRLTCEQLFNYRNKTLVVHLTYDNENLPDRANIKISDVQAYLKRIRIGVKRMGYDCKIRFFNAAEYGDEKGRPHYHLILFDFPMFHGFESWLAEQWNKGFIVPELPKDSESLGAYVAGYVTKKIGTGKEVGATYGGRLPPRHHNSKGFGMCLIDRMQVYTPYVVFNGRHWWLPRYLRNKLAEKFGILEKVIAFSKEVMYNRNYELLLSYGLAPPELVTTEARAEWLLSHTRDYTPEDLKLAYAHYYEGAINEQQSKARLKRKRGFYGHARGHYKAYYARLADVAV